MPYSCDRRFLMLASGTVVLIQTSCMIEEWIFTRLRGFHHFWFVALVELLLFTACSHVAAAMKQSRRVCELPRRPTGPLYLYAVGEMVDAVILTAFGAIVIGLVDNILRPILVGRDTKLPDYLVLFSTLGGLALFGITGFALGPLLAGLFVAFWQIFIQEFNVEPGPG